MAFPTLAYNNPRSNASAPLFQLTQVRSIKPHNIIKGGFPRMKNIMKIRLAAIGLLLAMTVASIGPMFAATPSFSDVPASHWAYQQINEMAADGIITGYGDGTFKPATPVSYGAFSLLVARAFYADDLAEYLRVNNVPSSTQVGREVIALHSVLDGTRLQTGEAMLSASMLTRDDMAVYMHNVLKDMGSPLPGSDEMAAARDAIKDYSSISASRRDAVTVCYSLGLLGGQSNGNFNPSGEMNRAQAAVVLSRLRTYIREHGGEAGSVEIPTEKPVEQPKPEEKPPVEAPVVTELPEFKLLEGEDVDAMMVRINAATPAWKEGYLTDGSPITEENITNLLNKFKENFPDGSTWDESNFYRYPASSFGSSAYACSAFASVLSDSIFGEDAPLTRHQNFSELKVGDAVWMKNSENGYNHMLFIIAVDHSFGRYTICSGNHGSEVEWGRSGSLDIFDEPSVASGTYVYSRY